MVRACLLPANCPVVSAGLRGTGVLLLRMAASCAMQCLSASCSCLQMSPLAWWTSKWARVSTRQAWPTAIRSNDGPCCARLVQVRGRHSGTRLLVSGEFVCSAKSPCRCISAQPVLRRAACRPASRRLPTACSRARRSISVGWRTLDDMMRITCALEVRLLVCFYISTFPRNFIPR